MSALESDVGEIKATLLRLEAGAARLETGLHKVELEVAELRGRLSQLPTSIQMIGLVLAVLAVLAIAGATQWIARPPAAIMAPAPSAARAP